MQLAEDQAHRRHLRGEPQLRQPLRRLGGRQRPRRTRRRRTRRRSTRTATPYTLPAAERREPHVAAARRAPARDDRRRRSRATSRTRRSRSTTSSRRPTTTCPPPAQAFASPNGVLNGHRAAGRLHARPRARVLPGAVPARTAASRTATSTGSDAVGLTMGYYDTKSLPIYKYLHAAGASALRDRRRLLPGGVRRLVPEPPVADRRGDADVPERAGDTSTRSSTRTACPCELPALHADRAGAARRRSRVRLPVAGRPNRACGDYAVNTMQPPYQPFGAFGAKLPLQTDADDRRPADREGRRLGVVRGRLVERRRRRRTGRAGRTAPGRAAPTRTSIRRLDVPELPGRAVPVPPSAVQLLRELRARHARPRAPEGRGRVHRSARQRRRRRAS